METVLAMTIEAPKINPGKAVIGEESYSTIATKQITLGLLKNVELSFMMLSGILLITL